MKGVFSRVQIWPYDWTRPSYGRTRLSYASHMPEHVFHTPAKFRHVKSYFISNSSYFQRESLITNGLLWYLSLGQVFRDIILVIRYTLKALVFMLFSLWQKKKNQKYCTSKYPIVYNKSNITYAFILNYFFRRWEPGYFYIFNSTTRSPG